ncbi:hypothetical protein LPJ53_002043, partial [Coemansia erecta]
QGEREAIEEARNAKEIDDYAKRQVGLAPKATKRKLEDDRDSEKQKKQVRLLEDKSESKPGSVEPLKANDDDAKEGSVQRSFWLPSKAPEAKKIVADASDRTVQCQSSSSPHPLKIKDLIAVVFRTLDNGEKLCPSCDKAFTNSSKIDVLKRCGHALCHRCVVNFVEPASACFVCQKKMASKDVIRLDSDGTGFSGGGGQMVATRYDSALQA